MIFYFPKGTFELLPFLELRYLRRKFEIKEKRKIVNLVEDQGARILMLHSLKPSYESEKHLFYTSSTFVSLAKKIKTLMQQRMVYKHSDQFYLLFSLLLDLEEE